MKTPTQMLISDEREVWVVYTNTDLTEGRGYEYAMAVCECESTAIRLARKQGVQGMDARVRQETMYRMVGAWYTPGARVVPPSGEDMAEERALQLKREAKARKDTAIKRARELGLSEEDIAALKA